MCELFGISSSIPVAIKYSLHEFAKHGGQIHQNKSGWGIAYHEGKEAILFKESVPASDSPLVRFIESHPLTTTCAIAHVRYATAGSPSFANTHPFIRELGGQRHIFAHNGSLKEIWQEMTLSKGNFQPIGETDSEYAFCLLLERLQPLWQNRNKPPSLEERLEIISQFAQELRLYGQANFLYSDGETLFVHAHRRCWEEKGGFSQPRPPGLSIISFDDTELSTMGLHIQGLEKDTIMTLVASVPLSAEGWTPLPEGTVLALDRGSKIDR
jgi:predicted glutamine amidotransferase